MPQPPLGVLLTGAAPALQRSVSTGTVAASPDSTQDAHITPLLGKQHACEVQEAAEAALHCPVCACWLNEPVTFPCGHSCCCEHSTGEADDCCPVCSARDGPAVKDFLLKQCVEVFSASREQAQAMLVDVPPPLKRIKSAAQTGPTRTGGQAKLNCSICLEAFPEPHRNPCVLTCGHALCASCVVRVDAKGKRCPLCREPTKKSARPCRALRTVFRFVNVARVVQGQQEFKCSADDLREVQAAVQRFRREVATAEAARLHTALRQGDTEQVELLANEQTCNTHVQGVGALHLAVVCRRFDLVQTLLEKGADITLRSEHSAETPLLLACGADVGNLKSTPLRLQAIRAMLQSVDEKRRKEAVLVASTSLLTPLHQIVNRISEVQVGLFSGSSFAEEVSVAELLIECGADLELCDVFGQSPAAILRRVTRRSVESLLRHAKTEDVPEATEK